MSFKFPTPPAKEAVIEMSITKTRYSKHLNTDTRLRPSKLKDPSFDGYVV